MMGPSGAADSRSVTLRQEDYAVRVRSNSLQVLSQVETYLHYASSSQWTTQDEVDKWVVDVSVVDRLDVPHLPVATSLEYGDPAQVADLPDSRRLIHNLRTESLCAVDPGKRRVVIHSPTVRGAFVDAYKAVRQIMTAAAMATGYRVLHASGVSIGGQAVVFTGQKGAGKSTMLAAMMTAGGATVRMLGNDRLLVRHDGDTVSVLAWPTVTGLGHGSVHAIDGLAARIDRRLQATAGGTADLLLDQPVFPVESYAGRPEEVGADGAPSKLWLTPLELAQATRSSLGTSATLTLLVEPVSARRAEPPAFLAISRDEADRLVQGNWNTSAFESHPEWLGLSLREAQDFGALPASTHAARLVTGADPVAAAELILQHLGTRAHAGR